MAEVDLESIPKQIGTAILESKDGKIVKTTGGLSNGDSAAICANIYQMLCDSSVCLAEEPLRRLIVSFTDHNYVITLGQKHIYIAKTEVVETEINGGDDD